MDGAQKASQGNLSATDQKNLNGWCNMLFLDWQTFPEYAAMPVRNDGHPY